MRTWLRILPFLIMAAGCGGRGTIEVGVTSTSQALSSTPVEPGEAGAVERELRVTVTRVDAHVVQPGPENGGDAAGRASNGWTTVFEGEQSINLLDAKTVETLLGESEVPIGRVTQVRLVMGDEAVLGDEQGRRAIACPSCAQTGLKIVTSGQVEVDDERVLHLTLDFDADASLIEADGAYTLQPVVRVEAATE
jgi:hypothetical protein